MVDGEILLDLCYEEDSRAEVDLNFVLTGAGRIVEVQATAEQHPFDDQQLRKMMDLARKGIETLVNKQRAILPQMPLRQ
jgi:ribonuclease PH